MTLFSEKDQKDNILAIDRSKRKLGGCESFRIQSTESQF